MKIRIATRAVGRNGDNPETMDDVVAGVKMPWIELDGHRFTDLVSAKLEASRSGALNTLVTFEFIGPVELVYVVPDADAEGGFTEVGAVETIGYSLPELDCNVIIDNVEPVHPDVVADSLKNDPRFRDGSGRLTRGGWGDPGPS